jgi:hypothetical protein
MGKLRFSKALPLRAAYIITISLLLTNPSPLRAAEYKGRNLDGALFDATVFAQDTGRRYEVKVEFDEDHAIVLFPPCMRLLLTLDDEEIINPQKIPAFDVKRGVHWEISIDADSLNR